MAFRFVDGDAGGVSLADNAALSFPDSSWTIGGWFKLDHNSGSAYQWLVGWDLLSVVPSFNIYVNEDGTGVANKIDCWLESASERKLWRTTTTPGTSRIWQHIMVTRDTVGSVCTIWINGVDAGNTPDTDMDGINVADSMYFGIQADDNALRRLDGCMAEWAKWDRLLTSDEILALVDGFSPALMPNSLAWYCPMVRNYVELREAIGVTNTASSVENHPRIYNPCGSAIKVMAS